MIIIILNPSVAKTNWKYIQEKYYTEEFQLCAHTFYCAYISILINIFKNERHLNHSFTDNQYVACHILTMEHLLSGSRFIWGKVGLSNWMAWLFCLPFIVTKISFKVEEMLRRSFPLLHEICIMHRKKRMGSFVSLHIPS